ncbi:HTH_Tnp_Tc3_2 domain-containing protein [Trichonephila clavipes]|nr:HTH_Tnp_Tc3_2 domain-containing protein [Trichonephila clavipes]
MPCRTIRAHLEQLLEFERGRIIGLKEAGWQIGESFIIWDEAMRPLEDADKNRRSARTRVSIMTIHRWLIERNLPSYGPLNHLQLTPAHYRGRLQRYLALSGWNKSYWGCIVLSDESCFQLCPDNHRRRVWRHPGQRADPAFPIARPTGPQPGVMVSGVMDKPVCKRVSPPRLFFLFIVKVSRALKKCRRKVFLNCQKNRNPEPLVTFMGLRRIEEFIDQYSGA